MRRMNDDDLTTMMMLADFFCFGFHFYIFCSSRFLLEIMVQYYGLVAYVSVTEPDKRTTTVVAGVGWRKDDR